MKLTKFEEIFRKERNERDLKDSERIYKNHSVHGKYTWPYDIPDSIRKAKVVYDHD